MRTTQVVYEYIFFFWGRQGKGWVVFGRCENLRSHCMPRLDHSRGPFPQLLCQKPHVSEVTEMLPHSSVSKLTLLMFVHSLKAFYITQN